MRHKSALAALAADHSRISERAHIGVLVPWANVMVETELPRLGLDHIVYHYSRLVPSRRYRVAEEFLKELATAVPMASEQLSRLPLRGTLLACTSVGFTSLAPGSNGALAGAFESILTALAELESSRIVLVAPYPPAWTEQEVEALAAHGVEVIGHASLGLDLLDDYTGVDQRQIRMLVESVGGGILVAADALVLSCTAWPTLSSAVALEGAYGLPVLSSNIALAWQAVRFALDGEQA